MKQNHFTVCDQTSRDSHQIFQLLCKKQFFRKKWQSVDHDYPCVDWSSLSGASSNWPSWDFSTTSTVWPSSRIYHWNTSILLLRNSMQQLMQPTVRMHSIAGLLPASTCWHWLFPANSTTPTNGQLPKHFARQRTTSGVGTAEHHVQWRRCQWLWTSVVFVRQSYQVLAHIFKNFVDNLNAIQSMALQFCTFLC